MKSSSRSIKLLISCLVMITAMIMVVSSRNITFADPQAGIVPPKWTLPVPSDTCPDPNPTQHTYCHWGSPALADIDNDGFLDIVAVTNKGFVVAVRHDKTVIFQEDVADHFENMDPGTQEIASSPAVGNLDQDDFLEIAVGVGSKDFNTCTEGGLVVLDHDGDLLWKYNAVPENNDPCPDHGDSIFSTPAIADLDNDGDMEITAGGFDRRIYAWDHNGNMLPGFPPDSEHSLLFPSWPNLRGALVDTIWGSPAIADLTGNGSLNILIGTDEGNFGKDENGMPTGWNCPYPVTSQYDYCGGSIYGLTFEGQLLKHFNPTYNFPRRFLEHIQSTPAIADVNNDGYFEIFVGSGTYYYNNNSTRPTYGFRIFGMDQFGNNLDGWKEGIPLWQGGKVVNGPTPASPAIGDITGDSKPEIIMGVLNEQKIYAFKADGSVVPGFPMTPKAETGNPFNTYNVGHSFTLGDYDNDGKMEIFVPQAWSVAIIDGNGQQLTTTNFPNDNKPLYKTDGTISNTPAVGDIDNDGKLELVVTSSKIYVWDVDSSSDQADWPMFKRDAARTSAYPLAPRMLAGPDSVAAFHQSGQNGDAYTTFVIRNTGGGPFDWSITTPNDVSAVPSSGTIPAGGTTVVTVIVEAGSGIPPGTYNKGNMNISATSDQGIVINNNKTISVKLVVGDISHSFVPVVQK